MSTTLRLIATAAVAGVLSLSVQAHNGVVHEGSYVEIDGLTVKGGSGRIDVSGAVPFGGDDFLAFEDAAGDSQAPMQGLDVTKGTISQTGQTLVFTMSLADLPFGDVQPGALYNWELGVTDVPTQRLLAWRMTQDTAPGWAFTLATFDGDGFTETPVTGQFTGQDLVWEVSLDELGAVAGAALGAGAGPITASQGALGFTDFTGSIDHDVAEWGDHDFVVAGLVTLDLVGAGGVHQVVHVATDDGNFANSFTGLKAGSYVLTISTSYADATFTRAVDVRVI